MRDALHGGLGLGEAAAAVALFPTAFGLEDFDALEAFQDIALGSDAATGLETAMHGHGVFLRSISIANAEVIACFGGKSTWNSAGN
jgi:hypothetical protein